MTPNSRFFFESAKHTEALSTLIYAIEERKGFVVITGDIGSGKTTVCRTLLNKLTSTTQTALITNTHMSGKDLLCCILEDLEVEYMPGSKSKLLSRLNHYLIEQLRLDNNVVVIIDEAQNLTPAVLEEVRMLSNLETENEKLIQIIFLGQPELKKKLSMPRLEQLCQRIAVFYHLSPLTEEESKQYILYRLKVASESKRQYFTYEALNLIYQFSNGVPRLINSICDSALLNGFIYEKDVIDAELTREVVNESPTVQISGQSVKKGVELDDELKRIVGEQ
ncbi:MAG: AAA family ATPase [Candidatus Omnitrophica bacterium]|nr:AAA family ATPase [Candidatus Omnitrophota bacterium]